jgi:hypothetical protein
LRTLTAAVILVGVVLQLPGCAFLIKTYVDDLKVSRISLVSADEVPHRPTPNSPIESLPKGTRQFILITLITTHDIASIVTERALFIHADIAFCGTSDVEWSAVYEDGQGLGYPYLPDEKREHRSEPQSLHTLQIWLIYRTLAHRGGSGFYGFVDYDLSQQPYDLCISISGAPYMGVGTGLVTNTVIVRKDEIAAILKNRT